MRLRLLGLSEHYRADDRRHNQDRSRLKRKEVLCKEHGANKLNRSFKRLTGGTCKFYDSDVRATSSGYGSNDSNEWALQVTPTTAASNRWGSKLSQKLTATQTPPPQPQI